MWSEGGGGRLHWNAGEENVAERHKNRIWNLVEPKHLTAKVLDSHLDANGAGDSTEAERWGGREGVGWERGEGVRSAAQM